MYEETQIIFNLIKKFVAESFGTFWFVLGGFGSAVLAAGFPELGIGFVGVYLALVLTVLTLVYAIGHISGCHLNPAVLIGLWIGGRFSIKDLLPYVGAQVLGGIAGAWTLYLIASGKPGFELGSFAANGYGEHSPGGYGLLSATISEIVMTFFFLIVILGATHSRAPQGFAGVAIGLSLTLIHLIGIPVTNTSVDPARSTSQAIFVGDWAMGQLWLFCLAPIAGAVLAGLVYRYYSPENSAS